MPRPFTLRNAVAIVTMAVASLCGGGKAVAEQKGTLSVVEVRGNAALRPDARKRAGDFLRNWLGARHPDWVFRSKSADTVAIWSPDGIGETLSDLPSAEDIGFHEIAESSQSDLQEGRVVAGHEILPARGDPTLLYAIKTSPLLDADDVIDASVGESSYADSPVVNFRFTPDAGKLFGEWTTKFAGQPFAIVVDGQVVSAPVVREPILGGSGQISGNFTPEEAERLALRMTASLEGIDFVVLTTCVSARPRAPPNKVVAWLTPVPTCE